MVSNPYQVLGVSRDADAETIKQAYRKLAKQYHPDLHPDDPYAAKRMNEINEAYDAIKNPQSYQQQQQQQQAWQSYSAQDPFADFFRQQSSQSRNTWYYWGGNTQNADDEQTDPFQWTVFRPRRRGSWLVRLILIYFVLQLLFSSCSRRIFYPYYSYYPQTESGYSESNQASPNGLHQTH
ncbi:MAG: DnaJ domain-containing protein [Clostridia bacterium]|nr:DnaJ domain-containing protein [Clostridia bacterium]